MARPPERRAPPRATPSRSAGERLAAVSRRLSGYAGAQAARLRGTPARTRYGLAAGAAVIGALLVGFLLGSAGRERAQPERRAAASPPAAEPATTGAIGRADGALAGPAEVIDTATLRVDGRIARLFGVEWARGGQAEELTRYLDGREVSCRLAIQPDLFRCQVDGRDLSEVVLYNGGGLATAAATPELAAAAARAKAERIGVWRK